MVSYAHEPGSVEQMGGGMGRIGSGFLLFVADGNMGVEDEGIEKRIVEEEPIK
jgi:hypothetical protein